jgi:hypothetical protein
MKERMASTPSAGQRSGACHERASLIFGITWLAVISPGADFAMISRNSFLRAPRGNAAALGIAISCWFHVFYAVFGLTVGTAVSPSPQYRENRRCGLSGLRGSGDGWRGLRSGQGCWPASASSTRHRAVLVLLGTALALFDASHALDG